MSDNRQLIRDLLAEYWGYDSFRPMQEEIILSVLDGNDTLGILPTGGGKSVTFQIPALVMPDLTVVVTPLISLMKDQVDNLRAIGIKATYIHSGLTRSEHRLAFDRCRLGKVKLLYVSPEKLQSKAFVDEMKLFKVSLIVVDEAHCISQWGYDFRPSYLRLRDLRGVFKSAPVLALTASATPEVADDIMAQLAFRGRQMFTRSFARDNISYLARYGDDKFNTLLKILNNTSGTAIVYVRSRRRTREIADFLVKSGISADYYHAGLAIEDKNEKQDRWKSGECRVIVATNAFGMGIDKPDVRVVVHFDLPASLEEYYQEAGRAGRDGLPSYAVILASQYDKARLSRHITESFPDKEYIRKVYDLACTFLDVIEGEGYGKVYEFNFNLFCERFELRPVAARSALELLTRAGAFEFTEEIQTQARLMVLAKKQDLYDLRINEDADRVLQLVLRTYTGLFADYVYINEVLISSRLQMSSQRVYESLLLLSKMHIIHYVPRKSTPYVYFNVSRMAPKHVMIPREIYEVQRERLERRVEAMKRFAFADDRCRVRIMLEYFGEKAAADCGSCDYCRAEKKRKSPAVTDDSLLRQSILYMLRQPRTLDYLVTTSGERRERIIEIVRQLLDENLIKSLSPSEFVKA
ncbi:MAG: RecQ family ATP-dependent DNA helicase [Muribaculaceae bacterium]|nr:RecQ family ATP-dependent DNA helicase [Muribaculaceae bacterium]